MTVAEARELARSNPKQYRAAFVEAPGTPLLDHPEARVTLHEKVGDAQDKLRARKTSLVEQGYKVVFGNLGKSLLVLERNGDERAIAIVRNAPRA